MPTRKTDPGDHALPPVRRRLLGGLRPDDVERALAQAQDDIADLRSERDEARGRLRVLETRLAEHATGEPEVPDAEELRDQRDRMQAELEQLAGRLLALADGEMPADPGDLPALRP